LFGVLKGAGCRMNPSQRGEWMSHICGTCLALQESSGFISRIATNYDAALLSVLYDAQLPDRVLTQQRSCILRRPHRFQSVAPTTSGSIFAASIAQLMAGTKIQDHLQDGDSSWRHVKGAAKWISERWINAAKETVQSLGFNTEIILNQTNSQGLIESRAGEDFYSYSKPTELSVGAAFGHTAVLANRPHNQTALQLLGGAFGRIMYLLDSYQDYEEDLLAGKFNPLHAAFSVDDWQDQAGRLFREAYRDLVESFNQLDLIHSALSRILLIKFLRQKGTRTLKLCQGKIGNCLYTKNEPVRSELSDSAIKASSFDGEVPELDDQENRRNESQRTCGQCCDSSGPIDCPDCGICDCNDCICCGDGGGTIGLSGDDSCCEMFCWDGEGCVICKECCSCCEHCTTCDGIADCCCNLLGNGPDCTSCNCDDIASGDCDCGDCDCGDCDCDCDFDC